MTQNFHPNDALCLELFPELLDQFTIDDLRSASTIGTYTFHEDYFAKFIAHRSSDEAMLRRIADYIERLASGTDQSLRNLAEIGILENLVSKKDHRVAPFLGPASTELIARVLSHFTVDPTPWLRARKRS